MHTSEAGRGQPPYPGPFDLSSSFGAAVAFKSVVKKVFTAKMLTDASSCIAVCVQALVADGPGDGRDNCIMSWEARQSLLSPGQSAPERPVLLGSDERI